jgi:hypothetical protein
MSREGSLANLYLVVLVVAACGCMTYPTLNQTASRMALVSSEEQQAEPHTPSTCMAIDVVRDTALDALPVAFDALQEHTRQRSSKSSDVESQQAKLRLVKPAVCATRAQLLPTAAAGRGLVASRHHVRQTSFLSDLLALSGVRR